MTVNGLQRLGISVGLGKFSGMFQILDGLGMLSMIMMVSTQKRGGSGQVVGLGLVVKFGDGFMKKGQTAGITHTSVD